MFATAEGGADCSNCWCFCSCPQGQRWPRRSSGAPRGPPRAAAAAPCGAQGRPACASGSLVLGTAAGRAPAAGAGVTWSEEEGGADADGTRTCIGELRIRPPQFPGIEHRTAPGETGLDWCTAHIQVTCLENGWAVCRLPVDPGCRRRLWKEGRLTFAFGQALGGENQIKRVGQDLTMHLVNNPRHLCCFLKDPTNPAENMRFSSERVLGERGQVGLAWQGSFR